jgi:hypothetical protein
MSGTSGSSLLAAHMLRPRVGAQRALEPQSERQILSFATSRFLGFWMRARDRTQQFLGGDIVANLAGSSRRLEKYLKCGF